ncbi:glycosyltransferase [Chryseobacterium gallinarum]|uniref:Glycosyltransferase family 4 protein n=1 Tax=Chryseobacterium gallinarum TaxID=1324352 RepID=A0ABX6KVF6_CHRGL|nr:glycosyltransferase [Chryseobacterium gallinarum]QIY92593.1 glycosyltransferase family 4 protein [Chryseobacterium gallinarum]
MDLYFITDARFHKASNGKYYAGEMSFSNSLWYRYLNEFNKVYVIARVFDSLDEIPDEHLVDNVEILPIQSFDNAFQFLKRKAIVRKQIDNYLSNPNKAVIIRGAGALGFLASQICMKRDIPYAIEVIGDPYDAFAPGVIKHPLRALFRYLFVNHQKKAVYNASAVLYVTKYALQKRYPANKHVFSTFASDVFIEGNNTLNHKELHDKSLPYQLISIGALEQLYKSPDIAIKCIKQLTEKGINVELTWLGKGIHIDNMRQMAKSLNLEDKVHFVGSVSSKRVNEYLKNSDIFLLLSKTEGLPRAMVEAMSVGLPCIGTNVGGIPELVNADFLVSVNDINATCERIEYLINNPSKYAQISKNNIDNSKEYYFDNLEKKRKAFFDAVKKI